MNASARSGTSAVAPRPSRGSKAKVHGERFRRRTSGSAAHAFTLVELLVVVGIIALLVTILMPSLSRALDLARKAICASQMNSYGKGSMLYVQDYASYPPYGDRRFDPCSWPKMYGIMQAMGLKASEKERGIWDFSEWEVDEVWEKAFCPAMDMVGIIKAADTAWARGSYPAYKPARHRAAAGYQWNITLRAAGPPTDLFRSGRWPAAFWRPTAGWEQWDNTLAVDFRLYFPGASGYHVAQAVHPDEIGQPGMVAEAWDSFDFETCPNIGFVGVTYRVENLVPGWYVGPFCDSTKGYAVLNGRRHPTSPNILYADGHGAADATKQLSRRDLDTPPAGSFRDAVINSWEDHDQTWGTMNHIVPECRITTSP